LRQRHFSPDLLVFVVDAVAAAVVARRRRMLKALLMMLTLTLMPLLFSLVQRVEKLAVDHC
jgi:hypothetical protein